MEESFILPGCPECCGCSQQDCGDTCDWAVAVTNSNNCTDDDVDLTITANGTATFPVPEIDASCLCPDPTGCRGSVFYGGTLPCPATDINLGCLVVTSTSTAVLSGVTSTTIDLLLVSTSNNNCNNFGTITVYRLCPTGIHCCAVYTDTYFGPSGGVNQFYSFPNLCAPPPAPMAFDAALSDDMMLKVWRQQQRVRMQETQAKAAEQSRKAWAWYVEQQGKCGKNLSADEHRRKWEKELHEDRRRRVRERASDHFTKHRKKGGCGCNKPRPRS